MNEKEGPAPPLEWDECRAQTSFRTAANPETDNRTNRQRQDGVPDAFGRIVLGRRFAFIYVENCPLCGLEHLHGQWPLAEAHSRAPAAYAARSGLRASHCEAQGIGNYAKRVHGHWCVLPKPPPLEWHEPQGGAYRLVPGPKGACFTLLGFKSKRARDAMARLARSRIPVSVQILQPRRKRLVLNRGD
jgi:hypothetical protein